MQRSIASGGLKNEALKAAKGWANSAGLSREYAKGLQALESCISTLNGDWISTKPLLMPAGNLCTLRGSVVLAALSCSARFIRQSRA